MALRGLCSLDDPALASESARMLFAEAPTSRDLLAPFVPDVRLDDTDEYDVLAARAHVVDHNIR